MLRLGNAARHQCASRKRRLVASATPYLGSLFLRLIGLWAHAHLSWKYLDYEKRIAGNGNRTRMASLEGWNFTIKLCPHRLVNSDK